MIVRLWGDVLPGADVTVDANFFDLGGTSLAAIRFAGRLTGELGRRVPVHVIFEHPTPRAVAEYVESLSAEASSATDRLA